MAVEGSFSHGVPAFIIYYSVDKTTKKCKIKVVKTNTSHYGYTFNARIISGGKTVCEVSISTTDMDNKTYDSDWKDGVATGNSAKIQVKCGDTNCASGWGSNKYHTKKTINLVTTSDKYDNNASGDFAFFYNTTNYLITHITAANIATITKTTTSGSTTTTTTRNAEGAEFVMTVNSSSISSLDQDTIWTTCCDKSDSDFSITNGAWLATLRSLSANTGYCFQLWYTDDELDDYKCLATHWYATSRKEIDLTATAKTSTINITADNGNDKYIHSAANRDTLDCISIVYSTSPTMPDFTNSNVALNLKSPLNRILGPASAGAGYRNCFPIASNTDYYIHAVKSGSKGFDYNTWKYVHVKTGQVFISGSRTDNFSTHHVNIHIDACAILHNVYTDAYGGLHDDLYYGDISDPISNSIANAYSNIKIYYRLHYSAENITDWALVTHDNVQFHQDITISLRPHTLVKVEIKIEENVNVNGNTSGSSSYVTSIFAATNVNVVKIGNNWAIPKIYDGSSWKETKAKVFVGNSWHDTREAHYDYNLKRWVV